MSTHHGEHELAADANGDFAVRVSYPYAVDVRGEGIEPVVQRLPSVTLRATDYDEDGDVRTAVVPHLGREELRMMADGIRIGLAYLDRVQPERADEEGDSGVPMVARAIRRVLDVTAVEYMVTNQQVEELAAQLIAAVEPLVSRKATIRELNMTSSENVVTVRNPYDLTYIRQLVQAAEDAGELNLTIDGGDLKIKPGAGSWSAPVGTEVYGEELW